MFSFIWNTIFYNPILNALLLLYAFLGHNLGWAIIVLTLLLKLLLYPVTKSQLESTAKMKKLQPQLEALKKKYPKNPQKLQEEQIKLYRKIGYNPLGCFFSVLIPFPILIAIYQAIRVFSSGNVQGVYEFVRLFLHEGTNIVINTKFLLVDLSKSYLPLAKEQGYFALALIPYLVLAILTGISQYLSVKYSSAANEPEKKKEDEKKSKKKKKDTKEATPDMSSMMKDMNKSMSFTFPLLTAFLALSIPAAVSLYWMVQSFATIGLQLMYNRLSQKKR